MQTIIGIDVGTTSIKCSAVLPNGTCYDNRCNTPPVRKSVTDSYAITFLPKEIWECVCELISPLLEKINNAIISVVCQAPSLCFWDIKGDGIGVSYLSYYGNPMQNDYFQRKDKTIMRSALGNRIMANSGFKYVSGLTGYIVFMLTGKVTLDSITAWEMGIESQEDVVEMKKIFNANIFPDVLAPLTQISLNCADLNFVQGVSLVGTTDSAVLPISTVSEFSDYYIYLGTWGSLLKSEIRTIASYNIQYHSGLLNTWLVSISEFISKVEEDVKVLDNLFSMAGKMTNEHSKIAICGGITNVKREYIHCLVNEYLKNRQAVIVPEKGGAYGAYRLAEISVKERKNEKDY